MMVMPGSETWTKICQSINRQKNTVNIIRIERIQSEWLWEEYAIGKKRLSIKNKGEVNEKDLYHGSSNTPPEQIGFDFRYCWSSALLGKGAYFTNNLHIHIFNSYWAQYCKSPHQHIISCAQSGSYFAQASR